MFLPWFVFILAVVVPFGFRLAHMQAPVIERIAELGGAVAAGVIVFMLVWRWLVPPKHDAPERLPDPARVASLRWPHDLTAAELEAHCTAYLRGEGWSVAPVLSNAAEGTFLDARRDGRRALLFCDASVDALRPGLVRSVALVAGGQGGPPPRPVLVRQSREAFSPNAEQVAQRVGVVLLHVAELPRLATHAAAPAEVPAQ
jgi:hypothetical protein